MATLTDVERAGFYGGNINLWSEDKITKEYLTTLWNDSEVKILIGGGRNGIQAILKEVEENDYRNVFGVIDRDFGKTNFDEWTTLSQASRKFILPRHEIENYLLDSAALAECPSNRLRAKPSDIDIILAENAKKLCWWVSCCDVIAQLSALTREQSISHPKDFEDETGNIARDQILKSHWFRTLPDKMSILTEDKVKSQLDEAYRQATNRIQNGSWRTDFPGKEMFWRICDNLYHVNDSRRMKLGTLTADFAKQIARWQLKMNAVPSDLEALRAALKARVASLIR